ncbi:hypothetical protein [Mangrovimonas futianensis]|uniref:hypothetical protein n=1 Tax=Mangrovimonas futianensis TaxID=2895523 RepID=UPI001E64F2E2|nr:hypothetical protein [Mangrovimonas futianensis]MCF1422086.1 hypothetical protein [Mangrovimonas futianensis]
MREFIIEVIVYALFQYPGAAIRWAVSRLWGSDKSFKEFLNDDMDFNGAIGILATVIIGASLAIIFS